MATKIKIVETYGKTDTYKFNPVELVPRFGAFTGRKARTENQIEKMVQSLLLNGQEQSFTYRKSDEDGGPIPVTGHTRILAAARITTQGLTGATGVKYSLQTPFLLRGDFRQMNEIEALFHMFAENDDETRTPLNDVDIALFIRTVGETTSLTDSQIAEKMGKPASWVSTHRIVLDLDSQTQERIVNGEVKFNAVRTVAALPASQRAAVIADAKKKNPKGKVTAPGLAASATALGVTTTRVLGRSDADFKKWISDTVKTNSTSPGIKFLSGILAFRSGKITSAQLTALFNKL